MLTAIDTLRGPDREEELQHALGVVPPNMRRTNGGPSILYTDDDMRALRQLAEAVEGEVRGTRDGMLGLDWGDE
jgi:hypothetical protein